MVEGLLLTPEVCDNWKNTFLKVQRNSNFIHLYKRVMDAITASQLQSKLWVVNELGKIVGYTLRPRSIALLGGWYAQFTVELLMAHLKPDLIQNFEIDEDTKSISYKFNKRYRDLEQYRCDVKDIMWEPIDNIRCFGRNSGQYDLIINTSCEHMFPMTRFYSLNKFENYPLYVLQSTNDSDWDDHINCVSSLDEFIEQAEITEVLYSGEQEFLNGMKRFMVIGYPSKDAYRNDDVID